MLSLSSILSEGSDSVLNSVLWFTQFLCFSPFCFNQQGFTEDRTGSITRCNHCPSLDHSDLVSPSSADVGGPACPPPMLPSATDAANQPSLEAPPTQQVNVNQACKLSGIHCEQEEFRRKLQLLFSSPGGDPLKNNIRSIFRSGTVFAVKRVSIPAQFLP